ncbi:hypothetical protein THAOC_02503, partial [Thalassiosira oceanica]
MLDAVDDAYGDDVNNDKHQLTHVTSMPSGGAPAGPLRAGRPCGRLKLDASLEASTTATLSALSLRLIVECPPPRCTPRSPTCLSPIDKPLAELVVVRTEQLNTKDAGASEQLGLLYNQEVAWFPTRLIGHSFVTHVVTDRVRGSVIHSLTTTTQTHHCQIEVTHRVKGLATIQLSQVTAGVDGDGLLSDDVKRQRASQTCTCGVNGVLKVKLLYRLKLEPYESSKLRRRISVGDDEVQDSGLLLTWDKGRARLKTPTV